MAIRKRGDTWGIDYYDPAGKRVRKTFKQKKDAVAEHSERKSLIAEGRYLDVKPECKTTLGVLCNKYSAVYGNQRSFQNKGRYLENFKEHWGAGCMLDTIGPHELALYKNALREKPVKGRRRTDAAVNREMPCLHHLFTEAVIWGLLERSPFVGRSLKIKENNARLRFLTDEEIGKLLDACPPRLRFIVEAALLTGMRRGEILSRKWEQVRSGFIYVQKTKTGESRQIPVSDALEAVFQEVRAREHLRSEFVFIISDVKRAFNAGVKQAGLVDFHFHDLRHTFASQVLLNGGSLKDVQELLGHKVDEHDAAL